jgi:hypothetical protein
MGAHQAPQLATVAPPTADELAQGQANAAAARARQAAAPWEVAVVDGGGPGRDLQAAETLEAVLTKMDEADLDVRFILPNGINRWTVVGRRR